MPATTCLFGSPFRAALASALGVVLLTFFWPAASAATQITRVSISSSGAQADGGSRQFGISKNARWVSFMSDATNLVDDDTNGVRDVFVHDRATGETTRVSVSSDGAQADGDSVSGYISNSGRYVVFHSAATNLVPADTNGENDVFVHDRWTGETRRVSVSTDGVEANGGSAWPSISRNARLIAFRSGAANLVPDDTNEATDVFVHNRKTGETTRVSLTSSGAEPNGSSIRHDLSPDGRYVGVLSYATNVVPGDTNDVADVFIHDWRRRTTALVSVGWNGELADRDSWQMSFSGNSQYMAFVSGATNLVPGDTNEMRDIFVWNRVDGSIARLSVSSAGAQADSESNIAHLSQEGHLAFFGSTATNLVPGDTNGLRDLFLHDRTTGETTRISVTESGENFNADAQRPIFTRHGRYVTLFTAADNLVADDTNGVEDVFVIKRRARFLEILR